MLVCLFNVYLELDMVPIDWQEACILPLYKDKENTSADYRGVLFCRVLTERVIQKNKCQMKDERMNRVALGRQQGCVDQVYRLKDMCEIYLVWHVGTWKKHTIKLIGMQCGSLWMG